MRPGNILHSRKQNWLLITTSLAGLVLLGACISANGSGYSSGSQSSSGNTNLVELSQARQTAQTYLDEWEEDDLTQMYSMVTRLSRDAISQDNFTERYQEAAEKLTLSSIDPEILSSLMTSSTNAQVNFHVIYHTSLFGDLESQMVMNLTKENGMWRVQWDDSLIHGKLQNGYQFQTDMTVPARGNIYDKDGHALAAFTDAVALGVVPGEINPTTESKLLEALSNLTGKSTDTIKALYEDSPSDWYIPIGEASADTVQERSDELEALDGLYMTNFRARYYFDGSVAAQVVGYLQPIPAEEADDYALRGYEADETVGASGLEAWGESWLRGQPSANLYVVDADGQIVTRLAHIDSKPAQSIYTTIDKDLESKIQKSMGDQRGAVVVIERDTGRILAMVSNPTYDANIFEPTNLNSNQLQTVLSDPDTPLLNRATQGVYPLGSVFKTITMAAALESGRYNTKSEYECGYVFDELDVKYYDWTYQDHVAASGLLNLEGGLIRSCNPWFWHIGLDLYTQPDHKNDLENMARSFGLGKLTGIDQVAEDAGFVPTPQNEYEAIGMAIGQDQLQVTPLQVADFIAAIGNGGTIYRPQLVEKISPLDGEASYSFTPEVTGTLPVSEENLKIIQDAMYGVIHSAEPRGTAYFVLANLPVEAAGKTGTAETATDPHAWFAGYTEAGQADRPDIAVAIILENAGEGSEMAAPIFRRIIHLYFSDNQDPGVVLPWESSYYQLATPEPEGTGTPQPDQTATVEP